MLKVWGDNKSRQISDAPTGHIKAVAGGSFQSLALRPNGTPVLWGLRPGQPPTGQPPIGPGDIPEAIAAENFHAIAMGRDDAVLVRPNGNLRAFGQNALVASVPVGAFDAATVAAVHAVAIKRDDQTLTAWGSDSYTSQSGQVTTGLLNAPAGGRFSAVSASVLYSLALHKNGTLYGWGQLTGVLATWTPTPQDSAIRHIPGDTFTAIAAGNVHALAIQQDGTVTGWGNNSGGALHPPSHVRFKEVDAGWGYSVGLSMDGTLWGWGSPHTMPNDMTQKWTFASQGWARHGNSQHYYVPGEHFKSIAAAAFHVMAIKAGPGSAQGASLAQKPGETIGQQRKLEGTS